MKTTIIAWASAITLLAASPAQAAIWDFSWLSEAMFGRTPVGDPGVIREASGTSTATITPGGPTTFCAGGSVTLTANAGVSYLWSTGETTQSIVATTSGSYTVTVTYAGACSDTSPATSVTRSTRSQTAGGWKAPRKRRTTRS